VDERITLQTEPLRIASVEATEKLCRLEKPLAPYRINDGFGRGGRALGERAVEASE
jgi:hypothetical protein